jgi:hypothetical protein
MFLLKFLQFLFFINLCDSFKIINYFKYKTNNIIYMGCDYYIETNLCINYNDNMRSHINLDRERGYYSGYDNFIMEIRDEANNMSEWEKMKEYHLTPQAVPFLIYTNNSFINEYLSRQYKEMVEFEIVNNDYKTWDVVKDIVILEERYERD